jgi:hypothetical protein
MASTRRLVTFHGMLTGQGHNATCTVSAVKVTLGGSHESAYVGRKITNVSEMLPEGDYELTANGQKSRVRFRDGFWESAA